MGFRLPALGYWSRGSGERKLSFAQQQLDWIACTMLLLRCAALLENKKAM